MERQAGEMVLLYEDDTLSVAMKGEQFRDKDGACCRESLAYILCELLRSMRVPTPDVVLAYLVEDLFGFLEMDPSYRPAGVGMASARFYDAASGVVRAVEAARRTSPGKAPTDAVEAAEIPAVPEPKPARRHEVETQLREAAEYATSVIDAGAVLLKDGDCYVKLRNALAYAEDYSPEPEGLTFVGRVAASWHTAKGHASLEVIPAAPVNLPGGPAYGHRVRVTFLPDTES